MTLGTRRDATDSRVVLFFYAVPITTCGLLLIGWGMRWLHGPLMGHPYGVQSVILAAGAGIFASGLTAFGLATIANPRDRHRALGFFAWGHTIFALWSWGQLHALWDYQVPAIVLTGFWTSVAAAGALMAAWFRHQSVELSVWELVRQHDAGSRSTWTRYDEQMRHAAQQEERQRLARELHDSVKQQVFAVSAAGATAAARFDTDPAGAKAAIDAVRRAARDAMAEMDALLDQLRTTPLENAGLVQALQRQCEALALRTGAHVDCRFGTLPPNTSMAPGAHASLFRAAQEALSNVARHARAANVTVRLGTTVDMLVLEVADDGVGYSPDAEGAGMGLTNIRERASELGGSAAISSTPGTGTRVVVSVPVQRVSPARLLVRAAGWTVPVVLVLWSSVEWPPSQNPPVIFLAAFCAIYSTRHLAAAFRAWRLVSDRRL